jgi:hypothetical protein
MPTVRAGACVAGDDGRRRVTEHNLTRRKTDFLSIITVG